MPAKPRVLGFGTYDKRLHPRIGTILEGLGQQGFEVRELNRPLGMSTADKVSVLKHPWRVFGFAVRILSKWGGLVRGASHYRGRNRPDFVVVGYMGHLDVLLARVLFRQSIVVLDHLIFAAGTAKDRGTSAGVKTALLGLLDNVALRSADVIAVDTEEHRQLVPSALRSRAVVVPVGAPAAWFEARRADRSVDGAMTPLRIIFFGLFTPLQGTKLVAQAIHLAFQGQADLHVTLVGDGQDADEVRRILVGDPVEWIPWVEPEELPSLVASFDVCLGIFGDTPKAKAVVPNKVYQGAAAGCAVITSSTTPQSRVLGDVAVLVSTEGPDELVQAILRFEEDLTYLETMRERAARLADERFTAQQIVSDLVTHLSEKGSTR
ncbi:glycosyltransferase [Gulosibacter sediminis]|uniref:glycosyltransferase n=1 Tax=Gulosibacter sediminis TaxID=1729695 RepID=UPI0024A92F73|nr:glycosyltransferase [Gulosibacter sediminis]